MAWSTDKINACRGRGELKPLRRPSRETELLTHLNSSEADEEFKEIHAQSDGENEDGNTEQVCEREDGEVGSHGDTPLSDDDGEEDDKHEDLKDGIVVAG